MDSGMFKPLQLAAVAALGQPPQWYRDLNAIYAQRRSLVFDLLDALDCTYDPAQVGMFVWARIPDRYEDGYALADEVLEKAHVFITPGGIFGSQGKRFIRVSLCSDHVIFAEALQRVLDCKVLSQKS
jgi:aspartate/methionine/tyrosine aminotransferase